ncbi:SUKH-3 domain-containing protein [Streptomyces sp. NPDC001714]|uniref:SUKH-3 domain-containing protein n=1 Tax=Streptomyces sp. NPDC001714 TaxID=3364603 RepID=UPI0036C8CA7C
MGYDPTWSPETDGVLRRAGWLPDRAVPTDTWEWILRERGSFVPHEAARRFLRAFGGLVTYGWPADPVVTRSAIRFDPLRAEWEDETYRWMSRQARTSLYPVGRAVEGSSRLGIAEDGRLYIAAGNRVELLGATVDQALDRLVAEQGVRTASRTVGVSPGAEEFWRRLDAVEADADAAGRRWPAPADRVLRAAGWFPGRSVPVTTWETILLETGEHEMHAAARRFLAEFGQVGVPCRAPLDTMPWMDFQLDPLLAMWDAEILDHLGEQAGADLYPVGMVDRRNRYLAIAEDGAVYTGMDSVSLWAATPDEALEKLTRPVRPEALDPTSIWSPTSTRAT